MENKIKSYLSQRLITGFIILSIALIAFLTYRDTLGYFFTDPNILPTIELSRIQSSNDVVKIFSEQVLPGMPFYRPITILFFSLDYSVWKLNPFGYHLTDLILHILVSVLVFFLIRFLTNGKQGTAWLSAIIFTTHPILVLIVPAILRLDIIPTLFLLLSLLLFLKHLSTVSHKKYLLLFSILFYVLALGSKEIAIILPPLIFSYLMIFSFPDEEPFKNRLVQTIKKCLPYFIVTFIYLIWRTYILQGIGGFPTSFGGILEPLAVIQLLIKICAAYFVDLLYPVDFLRLNSLFSPFSTTLKQIGFLSALFALLTLLFFYREGIFRIINHNANGMIKTLKILLAMIVILSLIGILAYPSISPYINQLLQEAYHGEGPKLLTDRMESGFTSPVEYYFYKVRDLTLNSLSFALFFSAICLIIIHQRNKIKNFFISSAHGKLVVFLLIWLLLPLCIFLMTTTFMDRYMYMSVIPFSSILSIILIESFQSIRRRIRGFGTVVTFLITAGLSVSLFAYSPLVKTYREWEYTANIKRMFLHRLSEIIPELSNNTVIHIYNLPSRVFYQGDTSPIKTLWCLDYFVVKSWLNFNYPKNHFEVIIHSRSSIVASPSNLDSEIQLEITTEWNKKEEINVIIDSSNFI